MQRALVTPLIVELEDALSHLEFLLGTFSQVQFMVVHLQCVFLKLTAWLDYAFIYYPMIIDTAPSATSVVNIVRLCTKPGLIVQQHLHASILL